MLNYGSIKPNLHGSEVDADRFIAYCTKLATDKNHKGQLKNPWMQHRTLGYLTLSYNMVYDTGLIFDGVNITIISTGISYNYQAYKNKMLLAYPESTIDLDLVYEGDEFVVGKDSGSVMYTHKMSNPFAHTDDAILGGYCVIKNKRGEFLTTLTKPELDKHRAVAKTDRIWRAWYVEMCKKTLIKKASRLHFDDVYEKINGLDNENVDLDLPLGIDVKVKGEVEEIDNLIDLEKYFHENRGKHTENNDWFNGLVASRKHELEGVPCTK